MEVPPLAHLLDDQRVPDEKTLRSIVKRRDRFIGGMYVVVLVAGLAVGGGVVGAFRSQSHINSAQVIVGGPANVGQTPPDYADRPPEATAPHPFTSLLKRSNNGLAIRLYSPTATSTQQCIYLQASRDEWATSEALPAAQPTERELLVVMSQVIGVSEGHPTSLVVARVGPDISKVSVRFENGELDEMTPSAGWVALTSDASGDFSIVGAIEARSASGAVVSKSRLGNYASASCLQSSTS